VSSTYTARLYIDGGNNFAEIPICIADQGDTPGHVGHPAHAVILKEDISRKTSSMMIMDPTGKVIPGQIQDSGENVKLNFYPSVPGKYHTQLLDADGTNIGEVSIDIDTDICDPARIYH